MHASPEELIEQALAHHQTVSGNPAKQQAIWGQEICHLIGQVIVGLLFYFFSTIPGYYGDENSCIELKKYSYIYGVVILIMSAIHFFIILFSWAQQNPDFLVGAQGCLGLFYLVFGIVIWVFIWIALSKQEECGSLHTLVWVCTIFIIIGLVFGFCLGCIACCAMIASPQIR